MTIKSGLQLGFIIILLMVGMITYGIYWAFYDFKRLPEGDYLTEETSPNGSYTVKAYLINGSATTSYAVRGELISRNEAGKTKTIYWDGRVDNAEIEWHNDQTVIINGHTLRVPDETFDFRHQ